MVRRQKRSAADGSRGHDLAPCRPSAGQQHLVIVVLAAWLSSNRPTTKATLAGQPVLQGFDTGTVNSVTEIRLSKGDGTKTTLKKGSTDWTVGERDYPADSGKVRKLLLDLAALNVVEEKTSLPENYPALGVEDTTSDKATGTRVDAVTPGKTFSLIIGKSVGREVRVCARRQHGAEPAGTIR